MSDQSSAENQARLRLKKRIEVAFRREDLLITWEIPDDWTWFLDDPSTMTRCKKLLTEQDIAREIAGFCPRVEMGEIPERLHVHDAITMHRDGWGLAVFLTRAPTGADTYPIQFKDHWHEVDERLFVVRGQGVMWVDGAEYPLYTQDVIDIPAGVVHGGLLAHPARVIAAYRAKNGKASYGT